MFVTKKYMRLEAEIKDLRHELSNLRKGYLNLWHHHDLLLNYLGLTEHTTPEKEELKTTV